MLTRRTLKILITTCHTRTEVHLYINRVFMNGRHRQCGRLRTDASRSKRVTLTSSATDWHLTPDTHTTPDLTSIQSVSIALNSPLVYRPGKHNPGHIPCYPPPHYHHDHATTPVGKPSLARADQTRVCIPGREREER